MERGTKNPAGYHHLIRGEVLTPVTLRKPWSAPKMIRSNNQRVVELSQQPAKTILPELKEGMMANISKVALFTNEYPPNVYGGAGVHVEYLSRELAKMVPVEVRCFGDQDVQEPNLRVKGYGAWPEAKKEHRPAVWRRAGCALSQPGDG